MGDTSNMVELFSGHRSQVLEFFHVSTDDSISRLHQCISSTENMIHG